MPKSVPMFFALLLLVAMAGCTTTSKQQAADTEAGGTAVTNVFQPLLPSPPKPPAVPPKTSPATNSPAEGWMSLDYWCRTNRLATPSRNGREFPAVYSLKTPAGSLIARPPTRLVYWNGMALHLGFPPIETNNQIYFHTLDLRKNISPLLETFLLPPKNSRVIVLDPGHGGAKPGTKSVSDGRFEKEFTLDLAKKIAPLLEAGGWQVFLTRTNDSDIALSNRVAFAEAHHADVFLSLHFNSAAPEEKQAGLETYCLTPQGMTSTLTRNYSDNPAFAFPNNAFDAQNLQLALRLHHALLQVNGHKDRGISHARFMDVLQGQNRPAALIECGYLSNPAEAKLIATPAYRRKLAEAIAAALD